jgi:hypothetical protein
MVDALPQMARSIGQQHERIPAVFRVYSFGHQETVKLEENKRKHIMIDKLMRNKSYDA